MNTCHASWNRRAFLLSAFAAPLALRAAPDPWASLPAILKRIQPPVFPKREFNIRKHGAVSGGTQDCTAAIRDSIAACAQAGGGRVIVPAGKFLTGAIHLKSNVNLHLAAGATLLFNQDPKAYLPLVFTRWEGVECMNYSPFVYAFEQTNIAITGRGTLDGQADAGHWWPWKGRKEYGWKPGEPSQQKGNDALKALAERDVPVEQRLCGEGSYLRPQFIQPYRCANVLIEGVTILNSPMWEIHPTLCRNVTVRGVTVVSHGPNNDGCNPESSTDVLIRDCRFDTGDDCIAIKSGRNRDGRRVNRPSENIVVQGCNMKNGHGGVTIGSEVSGSVRNVFIENCRMDSPELDRALRFKTNAVRGGVIENVYLRNVTVGQVADAAIHADFFYEEGEKGGFTPILRNVEVRNLTCRKSPYALYLRGFPSSPIRGVRLEHCRFDGVTKGNLLENVEGLEATDVLVNGKPLG